MMQTENGSNADFLTAFAVGTALGIGATLLLQPKRTPKERVKRQLKPYRKQMRRSYGHARSAVREGADATADLTGELTAAGRELLADFQVELARLLGDTRKELQEIVDAQSKDFSKQFKKRRRKLGI